MAGVILIVLVVFLGLAIGALVVAVILLREVAKLLLSAGPHLSDTAKHLYDIFNKQSSILVVRIRNVPKKTWYSCLSLVLVGFVVGTVFMGWSWISHLASIATTKGAWTDMMQRAKQASQLKRYGQATDLYLHALIRAEKLGLDSREFKDTIQELQRVKRLNQSFGPDAPS